MQQWMKVKKLTKTAKVPQQQTSGSAGYDLCTDQEIHLGPETSGLISTGLAIHIPPNHVGIIKSRSGLAVAGIEVGAGVIDSDYRGEVKILLRNLSYSAEYKAQVGDRIAQLLVVPLAPHVIIQEKDELDTTERGSGGFGSTGE